MFVCLFFLQPELCSVSICVRNTTPSRPTFSLSNACLFVLADVFRVNWVHWGLRGAVAWKDSQPSKPVQLHCKMKLEGGKNKKG